MFERNNVIQIIIIILVIILVDYFRLSQFNIAEARDVIFNITVFRAIKFILPLSLKLSITPYSIC